MTASPASQAVTFPAKGRIKNQDSNKDGLSVDPLHENILENLRARYEENNALPDPIIDHQH